MGEGRVSWSAEPFTAARHGGITLAYVGLLEDLAVGLAVGLLEGLAVGAAVGLGVGRGVGAGVG